jgi:hypothetical protein
LPALCQNRPPISRVALEAYFDAERLICADVVIADLSRMTAVDPNRLLANSRRREEAARVRHDP